jgi:hypothetical protein
MRTYRQVQLLTFQWVNHLHDETKRIYIQLITDALVNEIRERWRRASVCKIFVEAREFHTLLHYIFACEWRWHCPLSDVFCLHFSHHHHIVVGSCCCWYEIFIFLKKTSLQKVPLCVVWFLAKSNGIEKMKIKFKLKRETRYPGWREKEIPNELHKNISCLHHHHLSRSFLLFSSLFSISLATTTRIWADYEVLFMFNLRRRRHEISGVFNSHRRHSFRSKPLECVFSFISNRRLMMTIDDVSRVDSIFFVYFFFLFYTSSLPGINDDDDDDSRVLSCDHQI